MPGASEASVRVHAAQNAKPNVAFFLQKNQIDAMYREYGPFMRCYQHGLEVKSAEPFAMKPATMESGPFAGFQAFVLVPATLFPFEKLPAELRRMIYKLALGSTKDVKITSNGSSNHWLNRSYRHLEGNFNRTARSISLLLVSSAIYHEAREFLYKDRHFVFTATADFNTFMQRIGNGTRYITSITLERSGYSKFAQCYRLLTKAKKLKRFTVTFPSTFHGTVAEHLNKHWEYLKIFLLADNADLAKSEQRLKIVHFRVGPGQWSVMASNGTPLRSITPAINRQCRAVIKRLLEIRFS